MGLVMCTMFGCPIGLAVGSGATCCCSGLIQQFPNAIVCGGVNVTELLFFSLLFAATFVGLYIPLTILCTRANESSYLDGATKTWTIFPTGECTSEGGRMPYGVLGLVTGLAMGVALVGWIVATVRVISQCSRQKAAAPASSMNYNTTTGPIGSHAVYQGGVMA